MTDRAQTEGISKAYRDILYGDRLAGVSASTTSAYMLTDRLIWSGRLVPGQRLVESDLSEQMGLQRGFVREALRLLAADGIVELTPHRGARLRQLTAAELIHVTELLNGVFCISVDLLINRRPPLTQQQVRELEDSTVNVETALDKGGLPALAARYIEYHVLINNMTGNKYLNQMMSRMHLSIYHWELVGSLSLGMVKDAPPTYRAITKAVVARDYAAAKRILRATLEFVTSCLAAS